MPILITKNDFAAIADVANHCDIGKLDIAVNEAMQYDLEDLFCDFWSDIEENWDAPEYGLLVNGGTYEGCNGTRKFAGVERILLYYAYSRYLILNNFNDTPNGNVSKINDFSIPKPLKELEMMADKYRNMGYREYQKVSAYLCKNRETFSGFNTAECKGCGCNGLCGSKTSTKGYGIRGSIIRKG